jgi:hypothetical protein
MNKMLYAETWSSFVCGQNLTSLNHSFEIEEDVDCGYNMYAIQVAV